jgi:tryptophan-rich sensory protein
MKKIDIKKLLFYILIPLISGAIVGIITSGDMKSYNGFVPGWIFPVVWSILYILMGISSYLVREDDDALNIYKDGVLMDNLLTQNTTIDFISFNRISTTNSEAVKVKITIEETRKNKTKVVSFYDTINLRGGY